MEQKSLPKISIVTVTYNAENFLEKTIQSIISQTYDNKEYIIIDGGSSDKTINIIKKHVNLVDYWISEPDRGIYDAMNKAVKIASGDWLIFMNAGDRFVNDTVLADTFRLSISKNTEFIYSDWYFCDFLKDPDKLFYIKSDIDSGNILHQSVIYKKNLHHEFGLYLITQKDFISDYLFFNLIPKEKYLKNRYPISINDRNGKSSNYWCFEQKMSLDYALGRIGLYQFICKMVKFDLRVKARKFLTLFIK